MTRVLWESPAAEVPWEISRIAGLTMFSGAGPFPYNGRVDEEEEDELAWLTGPVEGDRSGAASDEESEEEDDDEDKMGICQEYYSTESDSSDSSSESSSEDESDVSEGEESESDEPEGSDESDDYDSDEEL